MAVKKGLGRGLDALITPFGFDAHTAGEILDIDINLIEPNPSQPRKDFDKQELNELAESIRVHGIISPVLVKKGDGFYTLVAGERRWRAARIAGLHTVPAIARDLNDEETLEIALIENLQRSDLNPMEEAASYKKLIDDFSLTQEDIANKVGKSRSSVANSLRYLTLPDSVRELLRNGKITPGHAKVILGVDDPAEQEELAGDVVKFGYSVREIENMVRKDKEYEKNLKNSKKNNPHPAIAYTGLEKEISGALGTKTRIKADKDGARGRIEIEFFTKDELDRLYLMLKNIR